MENADIERVARELQIEIWNHRDILFPNGIPPLVQLFDAEIAAKVLGIALEHFEYLPWFESNGVKHEIAGLLDRSEKRIALSEKFHPNIVRFTGAHEIGHWSIHDGEVLHRDRPIGGLSTEQHLRPPIEREADHFAACYLMPRKLVTSVFRQRFAQFTPFEFNFDTGQLLNPRDPGSVLNDDASDLQRAAILASARKFGIKRFGSSIAEEFGVSISSMAIRLNELGLIKN